MRAVALDGFGGTDCLGFREVPVPAPGRGEVLVAIAACGVCGRDVMGRQGKLERSLGVVMGHEMAGTVVALGPDVRDFAVGDRVASLQRASCHRCHACLQGRQVHCEQGRLYGEQLPGGYAEYCVVQELSLARIPEGVGFDAGAIAACAIGTGLHALRLAGVTAGQRVLVTGAGGGVGIHALQLARAMGAEVVAVTSTPAKVDELGQFADDVVVLDDGRFDRQVRDRGIRPDVVLDLTARHTLTESLRAARARGTVVIVGNLEPGTVEVLPGAFIMRELHLVGSKAANRDELEECLRLIARGLVKPVLHGALPLADVARAHELLEARAVSGRLVLEP
jgi:D-arabinose 1-dehydrogenase-like Zn-dependent alcohol dehydrogenase